MHKTNWQIHSQKKTYINPWLMSHIPVMSKCMYIYIMHMYIYSLIYKNIEFNLHVHIIYVYYISSVRNISNKCYVQLPIVKTLNSCKRILQKGWVSKGTEPDPTPVEKLHSRNEAKSSPLPSFRCCRMSSVKESVQLFFLTSPLIFDWARSMVHGESQRHQSSCQ